jgi:hypothetical protein
MRTSHRAKDAAAGKQSYVCDTLSNTVEKQADVMARLALLGEQRAH